MPNAFSTRVDRARAMAMISMRLVNINPANQRGANRLSRELASRTESFTKQVVTLTKDDRYGQLLQTFIITTTTQIQQQVLELLKLTKSIMSNPESYVTRQQMQDHSEQFCQTLLRLTVNLFLVEKSHSESLTEDQTNLLEAIQIITEQALELQQSSSPKMIAGFMDRVNNLIARSEKSGFDPSQEELRQAAEVFLISNRRTQEEGAGPRDGLTKFQTQAKSQLLKGLDEILTFTVRNGYRNNLSQFSKSMHTGISKRVHSVFAYLQVLENVITVESLVRVLCKDVPGFELQWTKATSRQDQVSEHLTQMLPTPDVVQFFQSEAISRYNPVNAGSENFSITHNASDAVETPVSPLPEVPGPSESFAKSSGKGSQSRQKITRSIDDMDGDRGRSRKRGSVATLSRKRLRTLLKRKPSIVDDVINEMMKSSREQQEELSRIAQSEDATDFQEIELGQRLAQTKTVESSMRIIPTVQDLPGLVQSFRSAVTLVAELGTMATAVSLSKNYEEVQRLLEILSKCNMWASGTRIENLPPSHVEKIEVQVVQKNYLELSEKIELSPDTSILVGCRTDGWESVNQQVYQNLEEYKMLMCSLATQILSLFSSFQKDISQLTFFYMETCIQRFVHVVRAFLQAQENYALIADDSLKDVRPDDNSRPLWEEAETRNKFEVESPKTLTKGTINSLIEALTDPTVVESEFNTALFLTYRSYIHPTNLLQKLLDRFHVPERYSAQSARIEFRALVAIREMLKTCKEDFSDSMIQTLVDFCAKEDFKGPSVAMAKALEKDIQAILEEKKAPTNLGPAYSLSSLHRLDSVSFHSLDSTKLAQMITFVDYELYRKITPWELLQTAWTSKHQYRSVNVIHLVQRLNRFTIWIASQIVWPTSLKQRVEVLEKFLRIGRVLLAENNFHSLMGIYAALEISAVVRLKHTFNGVKKKLRTFLEELKALYDASSSWKNYREMLKNVGPPAVPYLGISLTDLVYIEDGNKTLDRDGRINFTKQKLVAKVIKNTLHYQSGSYNYQIHPLEFTFSREFSFMEETPLYNLSLKREPRDCALKDLEP